MNTFKAGDCVSFGWEQFKKRPWFLIGMTVIVLAVSWVSSAVFGSIHGALTLVGFIASFAVSILVDMGVIAFVLKYHDAPESVTYKDLWHPDMFLYYAGAAILTGLAVLAGFILIIVPGIIALLMFIFVKYLVIERHLAPIEAMKESMRITEGNRMQLLGLVLVLIVMNLIGMLLLGVGLLVSVPVSALAITHAYRVLAGKKEPVAVVA